MLTVPLVKEELKSHDFIFLKVIDVWLNLIKFGIFYWKRH